LTVRLTRRVPTMFSTFSSPVPNSDRTTWSNGTNRAPTARLSTSDTARSAAASTAIPHPRVDRTLYDRGEGCSVRIGSVTFGKPNQIFI
jgi:hypothetical protein